MNTLTSPSLYPQPSHQIPATGSDLLLYKPTPGLSKPDVRARGFYTTLHKSPDLTEEQRLTIRYIEFRDSFSNFKLLTFATFVWEHISFAKDWFKYSYHHRRKFLPLEIQSLKKPLVVSTMYKAHMLRGLKFAPVLFACVEAPYLITGDQRWTPLQYITTCSALGFYYGTLTKRRPLFLFSATLFPAILGGIYGHLEDLSGKPLLTNRQYIGQRRESDDIANTEVEKSVFLQLLKKINGVFHPASNMDFDDDDDNGGFIDFTAINDQGVENELEWQALNANRDFTIYAIDCHPANFLRKLSIDNPHDPNGQQIIISQLERVIQNLNLYLRSQIISQPDAKHAVIFFNCDSLKHNNGICVMKHGPDGVFGDMHTLSRQFILDMLRLEDKANFIDQIGISEYMEGTTPFSAVISTIESTFRHAITSGVQNVDKRVLLFTPFQNPTLAPLRIFDLRHPTAGAHGISGEMSFRGERITQREDIAELCKTDRLLSKDRTASRVNSDISWLLYPLYSAIPSIFDDEPSNSLLFSFYNNLKLPSQVETKLTQSQQKLYQSTQQSIDTQSQSMSASLDTSSVPTRQGGSLVGRNQLVSLRTGGEQLDRFNHSDNSAALTQIASQRDSFDSEFLLNSLDLYEADRTWLKSHLVSSIVTTRTASQSSSGSSNNTNTSTQMNNDDNNKNNTTPSSSGSSNQQQALHAQLSYEREKMLSQLQKTMDPLQKQQLDRKARRINWDPKFFEYLWPDTDVQIQISQHRENMSNLREFCHIKTYKKRSLVSVPMYFPMNPYGKQQLTPENSFVIGFDIFPQFIETKVQASTDVKLDPVTETEIKSITKLLGVNGDELTTQDLAHYFPLGGQEALFFGRSELAQVKQFGPGSIRILGFKQHKGTYNSLVYNLLPPGDNIQRPYLCYPNDIKYPGSDDAAADLIQMCYTTNRIIIAQFIPKSGAIPRLVYLLPLIESPELGGMIDDARSEYDPTLYEECDGVTSTSTTPTCFQLIFAPFADDIRTIDDQKGYDPDSAPPTDEIKLALNAVLDAYTHKLDLDNIKNGRHNGNNDNTMVSNVIFDVPTDLPRLHQMTLRNFVLESRALGLDLDEIPSDQLAIGLDMAHVDEIVENAYRVIREEYPTLGVEKVVIPRGRKAAAAAAADGDDATATTTTTAKKPTAAAKRKAASQKVEDLDGGGDVKDEEETAPKKSTRAPRGSKKATAKDTKVEVKDEIVEEETKPKRRAAAIPRKKIVVTDTEDGEDDSDDYSKMKKTRGRAAAATTTTTTKTTRARAITKALLKDSSSDNETSEEETVVKKRGTRGKKIKKEESDYESSSEEELKPTTRTTRARAKK